MINRLDCVVVCADYSDFLEETLPWVLPHVDDIVVVTTPADGLTKRLCAKFSVRCLPTECFYRDGDAFNKARGINYGLANLRCDGWVLHLDADVVLPMRFRWTLNQVGLDHRKLYGFDRVNCLGRPAWDDFRRSPDVAFEWRCLVNPPRRWTLGSRIAHMDYGGWVPLGFAQLWHPAGSGIDRYPVRQGTAEHSDVLHAIQWPREDRVMLPEILAIHLETKSKSGAPMGDNWSGRKTPAFTAEEGPFPVSRCAAAPANGREAAPPPWKQQYGQ